MFTVCAFRIIKSIATSFLAVGMEQNDQQETEREKKSHILSFVLVIALNSQRFVKRVGLGTIIPINNDSDY